MIIIKCDTCGKEVKMIYEFSVKSSHNKIMTDQQYCSGECILKGVAEYFGVDIDLEKGSS